MLKSFDKCIDGKSAGAWTVGLGDRSFIIDVRANFRSHD